MGKILAFMIPVLLIAVSIIIYYLVRNKRESIDKAREHGWAIHGDLTLEQERQLVKQVTSAENLFVRLLKDSENLSIESSEEFTFLGKEIKSNIEQWLKQSKQLRINLLKELP